MLGPALGPATAAEVKLNGHTFTLPDGFDIELVAGPPLVERPIEMDMDEHGRLYVTDSSGSNDKVDKQLAERPHRVRRLEDRDGDGKFDTGTLFADRMMFPEGAMWHEGSLYVSAPPSIWKLTDTDDDGVADKREEWLDAKTLTGCANDLHGPYLGPDGWFYWAKGAFAEQTHERTGRTPIRDRAAHIFRCRPDRTEFDSVMGGGMDNPVGLAFTPEGERIFTTTFFQHPEAGRRDGLIHAIYGGVYGKAHDVVDALPKTGDLMPVLTHMGPAAPCGITRYGAGAFGAEFRNNLFACQFNLHKVSRHSLVPEGASYRTVDADFLVSDNSDFHPTDVFEDADGSLLVVDTGGWYKLCCPTSQLSKPDVLGAIYRVRKRSAPRLSDPRGLALAWPQFDPQRLAELLGDARPAVVARAKSEFIKRGAASAVVGALGRLVKDGTEAEHRRQAVWTLTAIAGDEARAAARPALRDSDLSVRHTALHSVAVWRDAGALAEVLEILAEATPALQRAAAEAAGRVGATTAVPVLLATLAEQHPRALEHSLLYALIEIGDPAATSGGLTSQNPNLRRATLIALDQMPKGGLTPQVVVPLLSAPAAALRDTASWIVMHRPEWGGELAGYFRLRLGASMPDAEARTDLRRQLASLARSDAVQSLLAEHATSAGASLESKLLALEAMTQAGLRSMPALWSATLAKTLESADLATLRASVAAIRAQPPAKTNTTDLAPALLRVARDARHPSDLRLEALAAVPAPAPALDAALFAFVLSHLDPSQPAAARLAAAGIVSRSHLASDQLLALLEPVSKASALELDRLLGAFDSATDAELGTRLIATLKEAKATSSLRPETLKPHLAKFPESVQKAAADLLATLNQDAAKQQSHLEAMLENLKGGDVRRGQLVFNSPKTACASCHAIGYLGGRLGPDLTSIGQVRTERDLLEAILYPSASFVRSYEPMMVVTKSGDVHNGVLRKDASDEIVLAANADLEVRIARNDIAEMRPGTVSIMPQGLDEQLSRQELADLLAFLKATRWGAQ
jgi:putative membrane-bound dehydrogenase-like protein